MFYVLPGNTSAVYNLGSNKLKLVSDSSVLFFGKYLVNDISSVVDNNSQHLYNDIVNDKKFP